MEISNSKAFKLNAISRVVENVLKNVEMTDTGKSDFVKKLYSEILYSAAEEYLCPECGKPAIQGKLGTYEVCYCKLCDIFWIADVEDDGQDVIPVYKLDKERAS